MLNNTAILSPDPPQDQFDPHMAFRVCMGIIAVVAFCSNGLLVVILLNNRALLRTPYNVLILSLAVTDMTTERKKDSGDCPKSRCDAVYDLKHVVVYSSRVYTFWFLLNVFFFAVVLPSVGLMITPAWIIGFDNFPIPGGIAGDLFCRIVVSYYLVFTLGIVSVYTITCLSLERWFAVAKPAKYRAGFNKSYRIYVMVVIVWLVSFLFNAPHLFEMELGPHNTCVWVSLTEGNVRKAISFFEFLGKFFIPLLITSLSFLSLWRKVKDSPALFQTNKGKAGVRLLRMCAIISLVLALCWFPNQFYYLLFKFDLTKMDTPVHQFTVVLCMGNSTLNPFIYCATNSTYRRKFFQFIGIEKKTYSVDEASSEANKANKVSTSTPLPIIKGYNPQVPSLSRSEYEERYAQDNKVPDV